MLFPWANAFGAISGGLCAGLLVGWMSLGSQWAIHKKQLVFSVKPVSVEGCDNATLAEYWSKMSNVTTVENMQVLMVFSFSGSSDGSCVSVKHRFLFIQFHTFIMRQLGWLR